MSRWLRIGGCLVIALAVLGRNAEAQRWYYPRGYGSYGWGGWGADPASGYMAGLGSFARGQGAYQVDAAKARAINLDTMLKWNRALLQRQKELAAARAREATREEAARVARVARAELVDGTTLNNLLTQVLDFDPTASKAARSRAPIAASALREIPFQWNTEAITLCLDQMTAQDALPPTLMDARFAAERASLASAVEAALREDKVGDVSAKTMKRVSDAVTAFHAKFKEAIPDTYSSFPDCDEYLTTLGSLTRLLHDPAMKNALVALDDAKSVTVGELLAFMQSYNLRFGPATTDRQVRIYETLAARLEAVLNTVNDVPPPPPGPTGPKALADAARGAFHGMDWPQLEQHAKDH